MRIHTSTLIDVVHDEPRRNVTIDVEDGIIAAIRDGFVGTADLEIAGGALLPGMVDTHIHVSLDNKINMSIKDQQEAPDPLRTLRAVNALRRDLHSGVTSARSLGDLGALDVFMRNAIADGLVEGPTLQVAAQALRPSHGTAAFVAVVADGVDEVRREVRRAVFLGADVIKLFITNLTQGNTYEDYLRGDLTNVATYSREEIEAAVLEAHAAGIAITAHGIGGDAVKWALEAGIDSVEHLNLLDERDIDLFLSSGAVLSDPNLGLFFDPELGFKSPKNQTHPWEQLPQWWRDKVEVSTETSRTMMRAAYQRGVKFALSTDLNHGELWKETVHFVEVIGASPIEAIRAVTINGARLMRIDDSIGTIEVGKRADLFWVDGDPLADIHALGKVGGVLKGGVRVR